MRMLLSVSAFFAVVLSGSPLFGQAALGTFQYTTSYGTSPLKGYVAILDLSSGTIVPQVTAASPACAPNTVLTTRTQDFANSHQTFVAITANAGPAITGPVSACGTPNGLIVSNGQWVNWPQTNGPVLYFTANSSATITDGALPLLSQIQNGVAGTTTQDNDCPSCNAGTVSVQELGTLLVKGGLSGACPIPKSMAKAARGAVGLDKTRQYLIVLVVAGGEPSSGLYTSDFALLMRAFGGYNAINFDGGGSSVFDWTSNSSLGSCAACASMILNGSTIPTPNPNNLTVANLATQPLTSNFYYSSEADGRAVYASIGFSLPAPMKKTK